MEFDVAPQPSVAEPHPVPLVTNGLDEVRQRLAAMGDAMESRLGDVLSVTQEMFPGKATIELETDPEEPTVTYVVVTASAGSVDSKELIRKRLEWHSRVDELTSGSRRLCLSLVRD